MCRNIRVLHAFQPPTTEEEFRAAALQYVRKVSGVQKPSQADEAAFNQAIDEVAATTSKLLANLSPRKVLRTREEEARRGRERWIRRSSSS